MIGYICKYTPIKILECFGEELVRIEPSGHDFNNADSLIHPNTCSYIKAVPEYCFENKLDKIVLVNCCDSVRRLYDVLLKESQFKFIHLIDVPRKNDCCSKVLFQKEIYRLIEHYETFSSKKLDKNKLMELFAEEELPLENPISNINVILMGARINSSLVEQIRQAGVNIIHDYSCTGNSLNLGKLPSDVDPIEWYSESLLNTFPCMRMADTSERLITLEETSNNVLGIIYHTIKFCDSYSFEYAKLKSVSKLPILKIETDYTVQSEGQMKTRIEAFIETLKNKLPEEENKIKVKNETPKGDLFAGIDSGSTSTNVVILNKEKKLISYSIVKTGAKSLDGAYNAMNEALSKADLELKDISYIIATGYGRINIPFANENITEITCHGKAAYYLNNNIRTIIDIGGQDSKAIGLDENGNVKDFAMNDKCAAGTGRFIDTMAKVLEINIEDMGKEALKWKEDLNITSMCTVFAESEVVSLIAQNKEKSDIIHGLDKAIASKTTALVNRIGLRGDYMMTGGVAKNIGVVKCLEEKLNTKIYIPEEPQIVGALGAALIAFEK